MVDKKAFKVLMETAKEVGCDRPYQTALQTKVKLDKMVGEIKSFNEKFDLQMFNHLSLSLKA